jgi:hypothetical protein
MPFTQTDVDNLKRALVSGVRTVTVNGHSVTYASTAEMISVLTLAEREACQDIPTVGLTTFWGD